MAAFFVGAGFSRPSSKELIDFRRRGVRVVRVHHLLDARHGEHLGGVGRPGDEPLELGALAGLECREHVIRQIPPWIAAPDAQPQPGKFRGPKPLDDRLEPVVAARGSTRPCAQPSERQCYLVHHHDQVGSADIVIARQPRYHVAAAVHERQRLGHEQRIGAELLRDERLGDLRRPHRQRQLMPPGDLVDHQEPDVVARVAILAPGVPEADNQLHYFFGVGSSPSFSVLPFLMTSGSAGAAGAAAAAASPSAGAATSSAFGRTTWTSIVSGSLSAFHFGFSGRSRSRTAWWSISSLTSMSMCSGMSFGRHCTCRSRVTKSSMPPWSLAPFGSPMIRIGTVTVIALSIASW